MAVWECGYRMRVWGNRKCQNERNNMDAWQYGVWAYGSIGCGGMTVWGYGYVPVIKFDPVHGGVVKVKSLQLQSEEIGEGLEL